MHLGGRHVLVECLGFGRGSAPRATGQNFHNANIVGLVKGQNIPCPNGAGGFHRRLARDTDLTAFDHPRSQRARFKKPRLPEPFIEPNGFANNVQPAFNLC